MPQVFPAIIAFLTANAAPIGAAASIATAGTTIGEAIANSGKGATPSTPTAPAVTPPNPQQLLQEKALVGQQLPNVVGATSGLANPSYEALIAQLLAGVTGQPGAQAAGAAATGQNFQPASSQATNAAVNNQPVNLADITGIS